MHRPGLQAEGSFGGNPERFSRADWVKESGWELAGVPFVSGFDSPGVLNLGWYRGAIRQFELTLI